MNQGPLVSVLFITYRRIHLLQRTVLSFLRNNDYPNVELVVADDGSPKWMQAEMRTLPIQKLVASEKNRGLGANTNAGLKQCAGKYILQIQDDWECQGPPRYLEQTVLLMEAHPDIGLVKFCGVAHGVNAEFRIRDLEGPDCYLICRESSSSPLTQHVYSDCPHLKRNELVHYLGEYRERCRMEECELDYEDRFAKQSRFRAAFFPSYYNTVFNHAGASDSFRMGSRLRRLEDALVPVARRCKERNPELFARAKAIHQKTVQLLYRLSILHN
ncbi:MAG: glycosyltransferase [Acidobacteriia bacterium]|nr:glycosyltransferase [Terriglobia bacterium]